MAATIVSQTIMSPKLEAERNQIDQEQPGAVLHRTTDLTQFTPNNLNRNLDKHHINYLAREMKSVGFKKNYPILVNPYINPGKNTIVCGHHRFEAAKIAKVPVWYSVTEDTEPQKDKVLPWRGKDYVGLFAKKGQADYLRLQQWSEKTGMAIGYVTRLLSTAGVKGSCTNTLLMSGKLTLGHNEKVILDRTEKHVILVKETLGIEAVGNSQLLQGVICLSRANLLEEKLIKHQFKLPSVREILNKSRVSSLDEAIARLDQMLNFRVMNAKKTDYVAEYKKYLRERTTSNLNANRSGSKK